jgi:3alpha(or 20beta)-hydroxysteroid dehydrogenase
MVWRETGQGSFRRGKSDYARPVARKRQSLSRVALVTGAARGQGLAIVRRLLEDGMRVVAGDVNAEDLAQAADAGAWAVPMDVTSEASWGSALATTIETYGQLDALVNNAGVLRRAALADETTEGFRQTWEVNCLGPFLGIRAALPYLLQSSSAVVVNTCSTSALRGFALHASYGASKWALRGLTQSLAAAHKGFGSMRSCRVRSGLRCSRLRRSAGWRIRRAGSARPRTSRLPFPFWCRPSQHSCPGPSSSSTAGRWSTDDLFQAATVQRSAE